MQRQGLVQINDANGSQWIDLSQMVACRQDQQQTRWVDFHNRAVLTRQDESGKLDRSPPTHQQ